MTLYYDEEGDYLEISIENAIPTHGEEIGDDITLIKNEKLMKSSVSAFLILRKEQNLLMISN